MSHELSIGLYTQTHTQIQTNTDTFACEQTLTIIDTHDDAFHAHAFHARENQKKKLSHHHRHTHTHTHTFPHERSPNLESNKLISLIMIHGILSHRCFSHPPSLPPPTSLTLCRPRSSQQRILPSLRRVTKSSNNVGLLGLEKKFATNLPDLIRIPRVEGKEGQRWRCGAS